jgi:hypothetical protein
MAAARATLDPPDQLGGLLLVEQATDRRIGHQRRGGLVELVALRSPHLPIAKVTHALHFRQRGLE